MQERLAAMQQAAVEQSSMADRRLVVPDAAPAGRQELTAAIRDAAAAAMRAAEAEARNDVLHRQADTLRAQSTAVQASLRDRVESLTVGFHMTIQFRCACREQLDALGAISLGVPASQILLRSIHVASQPVASHTSHDCSRNTRV